MEQVRFRHSRIALVECRRASAIRRSEFIRDLWEQIHLLPHRKSIAVKTAPTNQNQCCTLIGLPVLQFLHHAIQRETPWLLTWRELNKGLQEIPNDNLGGNQYKQTVKTPFVVHHGFVMRPLLQIQ